MFRATNYYLKSYLNEKRNNMRTLLSYLQQPSTWRGIIALATAFGVVLSPEQTAAIVTAGVSLIGVIEVFRNEKEKS